MFTILEEFNGIWRHIDDFCSYEEAKCVADTLSRRNCKNYNVFKI